MKSATRVADAFLPHAGSSLDEAHGSRSDLAYVFIFFLIGKALATRVALRMCRGVFVVPQDVFLTSVRSIALRASDGAGHALDALMKGNGQVRPFLQETPHHGSRWRRCWRRGWVSRAHVLTDDKNLESSAQVEVTNLVENCLTLEPFVAYRTGRMKRRLGLHEVL